MKSVKSIIAIVLALVCLSFSTTSAFVTPKAPISVAPATISSTSLNVFGNRKSAAQKEEEAAKAAMYWEGEWVCKDCGYIYQRVSRTTKLFRRMMMVVLLYSIEFGWKASVAYFAFQKL